MNDRSPDHSGKTSSASRSGLHELVATRLAGIGQRYTGGRRQVVDALADADRPLAMQDLLVRIPKIPQSSAYRHLTVLATAGVVQRVSGTDDSGHFELTDELSGHHHHHVVCATCGKVADISSSAQLERALAQAARLAAAETGFMLDAHRIDLLGTCSDCR